MENLWLPKLKELSLNFKGAQGHHIWCTLKEKKKENDKEFGKYSDICKENTSR